MARYKKQKGKGLKEIVSKGIDVVNNLRQGYVGKLMKTPYLGSTIKNIPYVGSILNAASDLGFGRHRKQGRPKKK